MFHISVPSIPDIPEALPDPFVSRKNLFTDEELDKIQEQAMAIESRQVTVGFNEKVRPEGNISHVRNLMPRQETTWIYNRILMAISELNAKHYKFDITGIDEPLYHVTYKGDEGGHYFWHIDTNAPGKARRKLAITFQMTDPRDYEGGDLEVNMTGLPSTAPKERGTLVLFPAYHIHRVAPVTKGTRCALVTWIVGPAFK